MNYSLDYSYVKRKSLSKENYSNWTDSKMIAGEDCNDSDKNSY